MRNEAITTRSEAEASDRWLHLTCFIASVITRVPLDVLLKVEALKKKRIYNEKYPAPRFSPDQFDGSREAYWNQVRSILGIVKDAL